MSDNKKIEEDKEADSPEVQIVKLHHQQWLQHPVTQSMLKLLKSHREKFIERASYSSSDPQTSSEVIRYQMCNVKNMDAVIHVISNIEAFIKFME